MYSTNNTNKQEGRQAPNTKTDPNGGHYVLHIEDVVTDDGKQGLAIYGEIIQEADYETPTSRVAHLLKRVITLSPDVIRDVMTDVLNRNQEGKR